MQGIKSVLFFTFLFDSQDKSRIFEPYSPESMRIIGYMTVDLVPLF